MKELIEVIAKALVDDPSQVVVTETEEDDAIVIELNVAPDDMGMVIGRHGKIAKNIRTMMKAAVAGTGKRINVEIR